MALPRNAARWRRANRVFFTVLASAAIGALAFILGVYIHSLGTIPVSQWGVLLRVALLFSIFGALFGTILALDKSADPLFSGPRRLDAPKTRVLICSGLGLLIVVVMRSWSSEPFPVAWVAVGAAVGGILGWFGWRWVQYVDF